MALRDDAIAAGVTAIQAGEVSNYQSALGGAFDAGVASVPPAGPTGITQDQEAQDIAAAVKAASDPLNAQIVALQQQLSDLQSAKAADDTVIQGLQASVAKIQDLASQLAAIVTPQPQPTPAPVTPQLKK